MSTLDTAPVAAVAGQPSKHHPHHWSHHILERLPVDHGLEPMVGKMMLPLLLGGAAAVWITCLLFFQLMLLAGYGGMHTYWSDIQRYERKSSCTRQCLPQFCFSCRSTLPQGRMPPRPRILRRGCSGN